MIRPWFGAILAILLVLSAASSTQANITLPSGRPLTLSGRLNYVTDLGIPHYEVTGYALIHVNQSDLVPMTGMEVVVVGTEHTGPTIFMRPSVLVERIHAQKLETDATPGGDYPVTIPVAPDPTLQLPPRGGGQISIPAPPAQFFGTPYYLLFGRLDVVDGSYFVSENRPQGDVHLRVTSTSLPLRLLTGQTLGAIGRQEELAGGAVSFDLLHAIVLSEDLFHHIAAGTTPIYLKPRNDITVRLRGRAVEMDRAPIIGNGRTLVGLRSIAEALGAEVTWNGRTRTAAIRLKDSEVLVTVGSSQVVIRKSGQPDTIIFNDIAPVIVGGRTMVPTRVLSEGLGLVVSWNADSSTVDLQ